MNGVLGAVNTLVLLSGSAAVAMSVTAVLRNQRRLAVALVGSTVLSGAVFMGIKAVEWTHHLHEGLYPSAAALQGDHGLQMFFALYYTMTGLHGIHVLVGMGLLIWALTLVARGRVTAERVTLLDNVALYWHLVDVIWIFLLGLFYAAA